MVSVALKGFPRDRALNVRLGTAFLALGLVVVLVSFSGNQAYDLKFFYVALLGTIASLLGAALLANSRVVGQGGARRREAGVREWLRLECPHCGAPFEAEGARPFTASCPRCGRAGTVA